MAATKKNPLLVRLGREGGKKGAKARMEKLTPAQRSEIARIAAKARWSKQKRQPSSLPGRTAASANSKSH
jgi:hypothetical protein